MGLWLLLQFRVVFLKLLLLFHYFPSFSTSRGLLCHPDQSLSLLQFKSSFSIDYDHPSCDPKITWEKWENGTDCCSWPGVTCNPKSGHVIGLDLSCSGLHGEIHPNNSLFRVTHLTSLSLSKNKLSGTIPSSISYLQHLTDLMLDSNEFSGQIPDVFGGLTELETLDLFDNNLKGQLPSSVFNLSQLFHLDCSSNKLQGALPNNISNLPNLAEFHLYDNFLYGKIPPSFLSLPSLDFVDLCSNQFTGFTGEISSNILISLNLCDNKLHGNIPESIFNVVSLNYLCLSSNNLRGPVNLSLSSKVQNRSSLQILELSSCNFTEFPKLLGNLSSLSYLDLSNNKLHGKVPKWLYEMHSLDILNISQNLLTSMDQFSWNHKMRHLDLSYNLLNGDISSSIICDARLLTILNLSYNNLTGVIPQCLVNSSSLLVLDLAMNKLHGTLPRTFPKNNTLNVLNLSGNQLQGPLPKSLSKCTHLDVLILANNQIEDTFPFWLQTLPNLKVLVLRENKFHGQITNLSEKHAFLSLIIFDISNNNFGGPLPTGYIKTFEAMMNVAKAERIIHYLEYRYESIFRYTGLYDDALLVTMKGINIMLKKIPTAFVLTDFSRNKFEGEIPYVLGELQGLKVLNLSHNRLNGPIPRSIGNLTNLESLDLSSNILIGGIPTELTNLNFLEVLNLSQNHLVGEIPHGKQFNTFLDDSYEGNLGLCGDMLTIKCNKEPKQHSPISPTFQHEENFGFGWKPVAIGYGCGVVFGMFLGYCVLLMGKPLWLVRMVGSEPNKRENRRRRRATPGNHIG